MKKYLIFLFLLAVLFPLGAGAFDLSHWKLQIPGPKEVNPIGSYTSKYFFYQDGAMVFWVNSAEKGTTKNSEYVRSELREMLDPKSSKVNWLLKGFHSIKAEIEVKTTAPQITVLQIHGIKKDGSNYPPLLRLAVMKGDLYAWLKTDKYGKNTDKILLQKAVGRFTTEVTVKDYKLTIKINGTTKLTKTLKYWTAYNYFKAGNYPQTHTGISTVKFHSLQVLH